MNPGDYAVGCKDSVGNTVESILGKSETAVVYTTSKTETAPRGELRWDYKGDLPDVLRPVIIRFDNLLLEIKSSAWAAEKKDGVYRLLGTCLFQVLASGNATSADECFNPIEKRLAAGASGAVPAKSWKDARAIKWFRGLSWPAQVVGVAIVLLLLCMIWAWTDAGIASRRSCQLILHEGKPNPEELIVLVHGYDGDAQSMDGVLQAVRQERPDADIVVFNYPASIFSNTDPFNLASELEEKISERDKERNYQRITLSGYSVGALLVRKAYVYGCGSVEDLPLADVSVTTRAPKEWVKKVDRLVLLAGMNRGWNPEMRPANMSRFTKFRNDFGLWIAWLSGTGSFIRDVERGEPFVANLRLQWLDTMEKAEAGEGGLKQPVVVQLLGDRDNAVGKDDSKDVTVARDFIWVTVNHTGHDDLVKLAEEGDGAERKHKIQRAFGTDTEIADLKRNNPNRATNMDTRVTTVVFVLHGIRDFGGWTSEFKRPLEEEFARLNPGTNDTICVCPPGYDYFPMGAFLVLGDRQKNVRWFMDQVTEVKARFPRLKKIHFIGHSNGTYILASALERYRTLKVGRVAFAGSVVRRNFPWDDYVGKGRVDQVRNYVGSADWVVGLFPKLFELPGFRALNPDIGSAGFDGFENVSVKDGETQFISGEHSCALNPANRASIVSFIMEGTITNVPGLLAESHPEPLGTISRVCWIVWLLIVAVLWLIFWKLPAGILAVWKRVPGGHKVPAGGTISWISRIALVAILWLLLNTV